jgi:glycosyltransferase involved in cell wall biosynthesis
MPTANRASFIPRSIELFKHQDYPNLELIILDDGDEEISHLIPANDPLIKYVKSTGPRQQIGYKRNELCELSNGPIIAHWDDDDYYPPNRLSLQYSELIKWEADIVGTSDFYYIDPRGNITWEFNFNCPFNWVCGNTMMYTKDIWKREPFQDIQIGEDTEFVMRNGTRLYNTHNKNTCIATLHPHNTAPKLSHNRRQWTKLTTAHSNVVIAEYYR